MRKIFTILICSFSILLLFQKETFANRSDIVINAENGRIMYKNSAEIARYPASLTKLMTLYIAFSALKEGVAEMDDRLPVSEYASKQKKSKMWLKPGTYITLKDAILSVILHSANDAATVIAEGIGGNEKTFVGMMNQKAAELGMSKTVFKNANGLYNDEQVSTAKDIGTLALSIIRNFPEYYPLFSLKEFTFNGKTYRSNNALLLYRDDIEGMKTGFVAKSGYHIVTVIKKNDMKIISVVMGRKNPRQRDHAAITIANRAISNMRHEKESLTKKKKIKEPESINTENPGLSGSDAYIIAQNLHNANITAKDMTNAGATRIYAANGDFSIQLGTYRGRRQALRNARNTKSELFAEGSEGADIRIGQYIRKNKKYYTARIADLNEETALNVCRELEGRKIPCKIIYPKNR